jgi:membrane protein implicated in regulation of membrane protease activity
MWDAVASSNVSAGDRVVVQKVDGLELRVDPAREAEKVTLST